MFDIRNEDLPVAEKRIAFIIGSMKRGGAERVISILANDYANKGWKTDIIMLLFGDVDYDLSPKIRLLDFSNKGTSRIKRLPYWFFSLRNYIKEYRPDVVLSFAARINIITMTSAFALGSNVIISERCDPRYDTRGNLARILSKLFYPKANKVIFQTEVEKEYYKGIKNGIIIPNPINVSVYSSNNKEKKIVTAGRLDKQKNHRMLIQAFSYIAKDFPDYSLVIYGDGPLKDELLAQIRNVGLDNRVVIYDNIPDIHKKMSTSELFVMSSDFEGLSNSMLEAMMMGLPVISTDVSGAADYITNEENGLIVPTGDAGAMATAIRRMLSDDSFREKCGQNAKEVSRLVSKEVVLRKWHEALE